MSEEIDSHWSSQESVSTKGASSVEKPQEKLQEMVEEVEKQQQQQQQQPPNAGNWFVRNKKLSASLMAVVAAGIAAAIIAPILIYAPSNDRPKGLPSWSGDGGTPGRDAFDDSAQANPHIPPLSEPFRYGQDPIRGVNLGGWLVIEPFITPSLFDQFDPQDNVVDEWGLCSKLGPEEAKKQLQHHYDTFITEADFEKIAKMGLNHVRIPTGHWAIRTYEGEPYVPRLSWDYLLKGIQWARKYGLRVMVELHTAPGSQNGWNHSGKFGTVGFLNGTEGEVNANRTLDIITEMVKFFNTPEWSHVTPVMGVLNEPAIYRIETKRVQEWYRQSHDAIRGITGDEGGPLLTYHEGFLGMPSWYGFFKDSHYKRVILETHTYLIFDDGLVSMPREKQAEFPCGNWRHDLNESMAENGPTMVGEFSVATNDCGKYLNGVRLGTRFDGTLVEDGKSRNAPACANCSCEGVDDWKNWTNDYKQFLRQFVERQMDAFEESYGWFFWTYKTEEHINPHWDYSLGWEQGWIPPDANNRTFSCKDINPANI